MYCNCNIVVKSFSETLNYSSSNEDGSTELKALRVCDNDTILCITGSGARPLDLLTGGPRKIISIDMNPCQNFLMELKMAAIGLLKYDEFLRFVGVNPSRERICIYGDLRRVLSVDARSFWDNHLTMIEKGVLYQGRWEKYFCRFAQIIRFLCPHLCDNLFRCTNTSEQSELWRHERKRILWRMLFPLSTSKAAWKYLFGDPGFYANIQEGFSIYRYFDSRLTSAFKNILVKKSAFAALLFYGRYRSNGALPLYLQKRHYGALKGRLSCVQIVTKSLQEYLAQCGKNAQNKYSLSDFASYTGISEYQMIWRRLVAVSTPGSRICERQFLVKRNLPDDVIHFVARNGELENELAITDDSIFYTFVVADIRRS